MRIIITEETLYDTELHPPKTWTQVVRAEEMDGMGARRLLNLDDPDDAEPYDAIMAVHDL